MQSPGALNARSKPDTSRHWKIANKAAVLVQKEQGHMVLGIWYICFVQGKSRAFPPNLSPVRQAGGKGGSKLQFEFDFWIAAYLLDSQEPVSRVTVFTLLLNLASTKMLTRKLFSRRFSN